MPLLNIRQRSSFSRTKRWLFGVMCVLVASSASWAQPPTSRVIPFVGMVTSIPPGSSGQQLQLQLWDSSIGGTLLFAETQTLDVDANGAVSFSFGGATGGGLDPTVFASGSSRYLDIVDTTSTSVLVFRLPLTATPFALSPGPQGPPGPQGSMGPPGPLGVVQSVTAANGRRGLGCQPNRRRCRQWHHELPRCQGRARTFRGPRIHAHK